MTTTEPTIVRSRIHYGTPEVTVEPYRATDLRGDEYEVEEFLDMGYPSAKGYYASRARKIRKDGTPANRITEPSVPTPANVRAAFDALWTA